MVRNILLILGDWLSFYVSTALVYRVWASRNLLAIKSHSLPLSLSIYIYIYIYIYITHTHTHTHIYIYICKIICL